MKRMKSGGGWAAIAYTLRMANRVGWWRLWKAMRAKNACKTCALGMGGQAGGMRNEAGHWPEVCKKSLQAMVADMQKGLQPEFFERYGHRRVADAVAARTGMVRPAHDAAVCRAGRHALSRRRLGRGARPRRSTAARASRRTKTSSTPAADRPTRPAFCCNSSPGSTAPTTSTIAPTTAIRPAASAWAARSAPAPPPSTLDDVENDRPVLPHRRQPGVEPSAADAHADEHSPPRRTRHRHQPGQGSRPRQLQRAVRSCAACCSARRSPACTCSRTSAATSRCLTGVAKVVLERGAVDERFHREATEGFEAFDRTFDGTTWEAIEQGSGVDRADHRRKIAEMYRRGARTCRLRLDDGHHAPRARRRQRAGDRQPRAAARHGRPAARRSAADSRALQRAGHRLDGRGADAEAADPRQSRNAT